MGCGEISPLAAMEPLRTVVARMSSRNIALLLSLLLGAWTARAVNQNDLASVNGDQSRSYLGRGRHVLIGILDGGIDANDPAIRGSVAFARDFSGSKTTDDDPTGPGHGTGIAGLYVGHATDYTGLVPKAAIINARVITSRDYTNDTMSGNGLFYALGLGAKVINLSYGNKLGDGPLSSRFNLMVDYAAEAYGASIVSAGGNDNDTAVAQVPAGAYNGYSIGSLAPSRYTTVSDFSNFALRSDRRSKPDLVAPGESVERANADWETSSPYSLGDGTSFSTPIVGGVLAQMVGYGQDFGLTTDPRVLKAIVLASATKVRDTDGTAWSPRGQLTDRKGRLVVYQPLDTEQGAGRLDAMGAYHLYSQTNDATTPVNKWAFSSLKQDRTFQLELGHLNSGERLDTALTWNHHVSRRDDGDGVVDAGDRFFESAPLADFVLSILKDGRVIASSDSDFDNLEALSYKISSAGDYSLQVFRYEDGAARNETFALAARVLSSAPAVPSLERSLEFAGDGAGGVSRSFEREVPEPSATMLLVLNALCFRRRRLR
jgi:hypothetical protein